MTLPPDDKWVKCIPITLLYRTWQR